MTFFGKNMKFKIASFRSVWSSGNERKQRNYLSWWFPVASVVRGSCSITVVQNICKALNVRHIHLGQHISCLRCKTHRVERGSAGHNRGESANTFPSAQRGIIPVFTAKNNIFWGLIHWMEADKNGPAEIWCSSFYKCQIKSSSSFYYTKPITPPAGRMGIRLGSGGEPWHKLDSPSPISLNIDLLSINPPISPAICGTRTSSQWKRNNALRMFLWVFFFFSLFVWAREQKQKKAESSV